MNGTPYPDAGETPYPHLPAPRERGTAMTAERIPIGPFCHVTRRSQRALRLYDERGLLAPAEKDVCTGYRTQTFDQIGRGVTIGHRVSLGFGLADVAPFSTPVPRTREAGGGRVGRVRDPECPVL